MAQYHKAAFVVCTGHAGSRGRRLLFADADGATKFADIEKLEAELLKLTTQVVDSHIRSCCSKYVSHLAFMLLSTYYC